MSLKNGQLLWRRAAVTIPVNPGSIAFDTGIQQSNLGFGDDPSFAERLMVIPAASGAGGLGTSGDWAGVTISDPVVGPNGTLVVTFAAAGLQVNRTVNVLFWDPHTLVGPGQTDPYNPVI